MLVKEFPVRLRDHFRPPVSKKSSWEGIVDLVTIRRFNLYAQLMMRVGHPDPVMTADEPPTYAASFRWVTKGTRARLESWSHTMTIGQPLPKLPPWLADSQVVPLDLEQGYEQACHDLWIT